jgi:protocatechuate 4,5-dioxygenase alpha chain
MARKAQIYDDIPGTYVFDAERSREGYGINMFCMSLMKDDNRKAFKANEAEYLKKFRLTPEQAEAVLKRDYNRLLELGGNIYFTAKLGATDGHSMMFGGGRSVEGNRSRSGENTPSKFMTAGAPAKKSAAKPKAKAKTKAKPKAKAKAKSKSKSKSKKRK